MQVTCRQSPARISTSWTRLQLWNATRTYATGPHCATFFLSSSAVTGRPEENIIALLRLSLVSAITTKSRKKEKRRSLSSAPLLPALSMVKGRQEEKENTHCLFVLVGIPLCLRSSNCKDKNGKLKRRLGLVCRKGRVTFCVQGDSRSAPLLLLEFAMPTHSLVREMSSGLLRIALECKKNKLGKDLKAGGLFAEPVWTMFCNGRKVSHRHCRFLLVGGVWENITICCFFFYLWVFGKMLVCCFSFYFWVFGRIPICCFFFFFWVFWENIPICCFFFFFWVFGRISVCCFFFFPWVFGRIVWCRARNPCGCLFLNQCRSAWQLSGSL